MSRVRSWVTAWTSYEEEMDRLSTSEHGTDRSALAARERIIRNFQSEGLNAARALLDIRNECLYSVKGYKTFGEYCKEEWGITSARASQICTFAKAIPEAVDFDSTFWLTEHAARPLTYLEDETERLGAIKDLREMAGQQEKPISHEQVSSVVNSRHLAAENQKRLDRAEPTPEFDDEELIAEHEIPEDELPPPPMQIVDMLGNNWTLNDASALSNDRIAKTFNEAREAMAVCDEIQDAYKRLREVGSKHLSRALPWGFMRRTLEELLTAAKTKMPWTLEEDTANVLNYGQYKMTERGLNEKITKEAEKPSTTVDIPDDL